MDNYTFSYYDIQQQVIAFMLQNGIFPYDQNMPISTDGRIHRFRTRDDDTGDKSGTYCIFYDGWPAGFVQDWHNHTGAISWSFPRDNLSLEGQSFFDDDKYKKALKIARQHQQEALKLQKEKQVEASENARIRFEQAERATVNHPYLQKKMSLLSVFVLWTVSSLCLFVILTVASCLYSGLMLRGEKVLP